MTRAKFRFKRLRMDLESDDEFKFESDDDEMVSTAAAVAAVEVPEEKLSITETLQLSGKRKRWINDWETQNQWKVSRNNSSAGVRIMRWGSWLGKVEYPQCHSPSPVARLPVNVAKKLDISHGPSSSPCAPKLAKNVELLDKQLTQAGRVRSVDRPKLLVMRGDPTDWKTEAIVNDANSLLHHNCGLSATIVRKGGLEIQRQSSEWVFYNGKVPVGSAMWTTAGKLSNAFIIHAVGPDVRYHRWPPKHHQQELRQAVRSALRLADELAVTSVTIPALCTGVSCYPKYLAARQVVAESLEYCDDYPLTTLRLIVFMSEDAATTSAFVQALTNEREERQRGRQ